MMSAVHKLLQSRTATKTAEVSLKNLSSVAGNGLFRNNSGAFRYLSHTCPDLNMKEILPKSATKFIFHHTFLTTALTPVTRLLRKNVHCRYCSMQNIQKLCVRLLSTSNLRNSDEFSKENVQPTIALDPMSLDSVTNFLPFLSKFQSLVTSCVEPERMASHLDEDLTRKLIRFSATEQNKLALIIGTEIFQNLLRNMMEKTQDIPPSDIPQIMYCLDWLCVKSDHDLLVKLWDLALENLHFYSVRDLSLLSQCAESSPNSTDKSEKLLQSLNATLASSNPSQFFLEIDNMISIWENLGNCVSDTDIWRGSVNFLIKLLKDEKVPVTLNTLAAVESLNEATHFQFQDVLDKEMFTAVSRLEEGACNIIVQDQDLSFCVRIMRVLSRCHWLEEHPVLREIEKQCLEKVDSCADVVDIIKLLSFITRTDLVEKRVAEIVKEGIDGANDYVFYQILQTCSRKKMCGGRSPFSRELTNTIYQRMTTTIESLTSDQLDRLLWQEGGQVAKIFLWLIARVHVTKLVTWSNEIGGVLQSRLKSKLNQATLTKSEASIVLTAVVDTIRCGQSIGPLELARTIELMPQLDISDLLTFHRQLNGFLIRQCPVGAFLRKQAQSLKMHLWENIESRLQESTDVLHGLLVYSNTLSPRGDDGNTRLNKNWQLWDRVMADLPKWISDESDCSIALVILHNLGQSLCCDETLNPLVLSVIEKEELNILSGLQLCELLANSGYQGCQFEQFWVWVYSLAAEVLASSWISRATKVSLGYHLSILSIFPEDLINHIFSLDFLMELQKDLREMPSSLSTKVRTQMCHLNRAVCIEAPYLQVPWFTNTSSEAPSDMPLPYQRLCDSLLRLCGGGSCLQTSVWSPYGHFIDFQLLFNGKGKGSLVQPGQSSNHQDIEKLAVLYLKPSSFCHDNQSVLGQVKAEVRQLEMLGYFIVMLPYHSLTSMAVQTEEGLDNFVTEQVTQVLGMNIFNKTTDTSSSTDL